MAGEEREYPHWGRVYLIVIIYTIAIITALWLFTRAYS